MLHRMGIGGRSRFVVERRQYLLEGWVDGVAELVRVERHDHTAFVRVAEAVYWWPEHEGKVWPALVVPGPDWGGVPRSQTPGRISKRQSAWTTDIGGSLFLSRASSAITAFDKSRYTRCSGWNQTVRTQSWRSPSKRLFQLSNRRRLTTNATTVSRPTRTAVTSAELSDTFPTAGMV